MSFFKKLFGGESEPPSPPLDNVALLKEIILESVELKTRLNNVDPSAFIDEVVIISREQDLPFTRQEFLDYAKSTGHSLPAVCMAYYGGGMM